MENLEQIKNFIETVLDKPTFDKWIVPLSFLAVANKIILAGSTDSKKLSWIKQNLLDKINSLTKKEFGLSLKLISLNEEEDDFSLSSPAVELTGKARSFKETNLQKKYTFDSFVQLDQNRMACSFAHSVAEFPAKSYNPLYIYSDVGLGKTHLMVAIGNRILENNKNFNVRYLTTNDLMKEYVEYTRQNKVSEFTKKYTSVDILLVDDIQYITRWGGTREQFYYIFNKLIQLEKQIVICSDKHPDNIPDLEHRIKSRFEWGGLVDIHHYDLEGRIAILKTKIEERKELFKNDFVIPEDVIFFLASSISDNIRKLEGALNRLIGVANLKFSDTRKSPITLAFVKEALKPFISLRKKPATVKGIQEFVAQKFNIKVNDLISKSNKKDIAYPRQIAMFVCKKLTKIPLYEIGDKFGGKHHSTVLHSIKKIEKRMEANYEFDKEINDLIEFFKT
ncbi:MAG: chromosomal replication initiator protein DnaA [Candidatus Aminicenantes bacterium]|nr:chromosomal replication initiator protein DnaA [Candidatus Aminicenantes bacterium]